jgi:DNA polymerase-3 subunit beta
MVEVKFSISQAELQKALGTVLKGAATHSTLPILAGVHMHTLDDTVVFQTTDLDRSIQYVVPALIEEAGATVVPAKLFTDIAKSLPDAAVHFEVNDRDASIICDSSTFSIHTMSSEDFPGFPRIDVEQSIEVPFSDFSSMVKRVARVVSRDETRAILTGVFITVMDGQLRMVATDSYRLALTDNVNVTGLGEFSATIPGTFLQELAGLPDSAAPLVLSVSFNQIMVNYQDITYINRRLEGNFPNYRQLLPDSYNTRVTFDTRELQAAVKRVSLLSKTSAPVKFDINIASQTAMLTTASQEMGSAQEILRVQAEGEDVVIAFNSAFISDGLSVMPTNETYLDIQNSMRPGIFRAVEGEDFLYLIMPVRLSS